MNSLVLADSWSRGVLIGLPIACVFVLAGLVGAALLFRYARRNQNAYDSTDALMLGGVAAVAPVILLVGTAWAMYPWQGEYHRWQDKSGTVAEVSSRLLSNSDNVNQKFVVRFEGGGEYGCNDTRCSLVKVGDDLTLSCKRAWQFSGRDGWDCNYVERRGGAS